MIPVRLISSSLRGVTALTSNQLTPALGVSQTTTTPVALNNSNSQPRLLPAQWAQQCQRSLASTSRDPTSFYRTKGFLPEVTADLPPKPKKPSSSWIMFLRERKDSVLREHGQISGTKLSTILAKEWKEIDKTRYEQEFKQLLDEYKHQVDSWWSSLTDDQRRQYYQQKSAKSHNKTLKTLRATNPPKMPRSALNLYVQKRSAAEDIRELMKTTKQSEILRKINEEYRSLADWEKQKYLDMQQEDKIRFQHEFLAWYDGIQNDEDLNQAVWNLAEKMHDRMKRLKYI